MSYCFRYRVKMLTPPQTNDGDTITLELPDLPPVTGTVSEAYPAGKWVIFIVRGFETEEAAKVAGEKFGDALLVVGAVMRLGIDVGFNRATLQFSDAVHEAVQRVDGRKLLSEIHGLLTYEENTITIIGVEARGQTKISGNAFEDYLKSWKSFVGNLTERQRNCALLLNDSFFVSKTESQFILRISAVETLCEQGIVVGEYRSIIESIVCFVESLSMSAESSEAVRRMLENALRESIRQSYLSKFRMLLTDTDAKSFDDLYQQRSKLVHDGLGRGALSQASAEALKLATDLLEAELKQTLPY